MNQGQEKKAEAARKAAAIALQKLCFDAAQKEPGAFMNRDRSLEVVDAVVVAVLETLDAYLRHPQDQEVDRAG
jgi:hypothetical protein